MTIYIMNDKDYKEYFYSKLRITKNNEGSFYYLNIILGIFFTHCFIIGIVKRVFVDIAHS